MQRINLAQFAEGDSRVYAGVNRGRNAAAVEDLVLVGTNDRIEIHVPEDTIAVTFSFFCGMFEDIIERLGRDAFETIFTFTGRDISRVIEAALNDGDRFRRFKTP